MIIQIEHLQFALLREGNLDLIHISISMVLNVDIYVLLHWKSLLNKISLDIGQM